ncbi:MAG TPA: hypothetical protein VFS34_04450 [Thermoanaerobaculia bacterium]|nr:hypothetical protein [Thermoanaerobaculia bacterium]
MSAVGRPAAGWAGVLLPPISWLADLTLSDSLVGESCVRGNRALLHGATLLAIAGAGAGVAIAFANFRRARQDASARGRVARFLGLGGMALGAMFLLAILAMQLPKLMLGPCAP